MAKLNHVIYDWMPIEGKDTAMSSALERYEKKHEELGNGNYRQIARQLKLLANEDEAGGAITLKAQAPQRQGLFRRKPSKALAKVSEDTVVVIIAHGSKSKIAVGYDVEDKVRMISAHDLAEMLQLDGLPQRHRFIKLNSCYAAGGDGFELDETFAQRLAKELGTIGYDHVLVGGYENRLSSPRDPNQKKTSTFSTFDDKVGTKDVTKEVAGGRTWYDHDGNKVHTGKLSGFTG